MNDLISRSELLKKEKYVNTETGYTRVVKVDDIKNAPAEDGVVHGYWKQVVWYGIYRYECSECAGEVPKNSRGGDWFTAYCPHCGAKMDADAGNKEGD